MVTIRRVEDPRVGQAQLARQTGDSPDPGHTCNIHGTTIVNILKSMDNDWIHCTSFLGYKIILFRVLDKFSLPFRLEMVVILVTPDIDIYFVSRKMIGSGGCCRSCS